MKRLALVWIAVVVSGAVAHVQQQEPAPRLEAENFSRLGFKDLRALGS